MDCSDKVTGRSRGSPCVGFRCGVAMWNNDYGFEGGEKLNAYDPTIQTVMLAGGYRNRDFIDYQNTRTRFMFNLGAGGGAILLQKDVKKNILLESAIITDGSFSEDVVVTAGGTKNPISSEALEQGLYRLDVLDPEGMKRRFEKKSLENFIKVVRESLFKSGYTVQDIGYIAMLHMKKSAHEYVLKQLGLSEDQSIYLEDYGHIGQIDQILSLELAEREGKLQSGMSF